MGSRARQASWPLWVASPQVVLIPSPDVPSVPATATAQKSHYSGWALRMCEVLLGFTCRTTLSHSVLSVWEPQHHLEVLLKQIPGPHPLRFWFRKSGWGPRIRISKEFTGAADPTLNNIVIADLEVLSCAWGYGLVGSRFQAQLCFESAVHMVNPGKGGDVFTSVDRALALVCCYLRCYLFTDYKEMLGLTYEIQANIF